MPFPAKRRADPEHLFWPCLFRVFALFLFLVRFGTLPLDSQQTDTASVVRMVDAAVQHRVESVTGFTAIEHYSVYRGKNETQPVAELTARDTYKKGIGKTYVVLSEGGSRIVQKFGLHPLLDSEKAINEPGKVEQSWFTSANYEMQLKPGGVQRVNSRDCYALAITPRHPAPNMISGTLWVDAKEGFIVKVDGVASKSPSAFAGTTRMMREYTQVEGFPMAANARAESSSLLFGRTVVVIEYREYRVQVSSQSADVPLATRP